MIMLLFSSLIAITVSFFCSLTESVLLSLNPLTINKMKYRHPGAAAAWTHMKRNIARPIAAILILNTVAHTGGATVAGGAFVKIYGEHRIWIFSTVFTLIILFLTEIFPKVLGVRYRDMLAPLVARPVDLTTRVLGPAIRICDALFGRFRSDPECEQITTSDIITLAAMAKAGKAIGLEQENIMVNAIRLNHTTVDRVMLPCEKVSCIKADATKEEVFGLLADAGHTRYPIITQGCLDKVSSFVNAKVLLSPPGDQTNLSEVARPLLSVQTGETLLSALKLMIEKRQHMLAVCNAAGKWLGIITLEDITDELLGADLETFR